MKIEKVLNLPSGRIFLATTKDGYPIEFTEMQDVSVDGKLHAEVRETQDPRVIWKHLVPHKDKWLLTVSTQKGCPHECKFCDVAPMQFKGNLTSAEILDQIKLIIKMSPHVGPTSKAKIGFARMGEPAWNIDNVEVAINIMQQMYPQHRWLPCFNTILPTQCKDTIGRVMFMKLKEDGFLHFQISCNSTDEAQRVELFGGASVMELDAIVHQVNKYPAHGRTTTLNFIVMKGIEIDIVKLKKMGLNRDKFCVKLIPLNQTLNGDSNNLEPEVNYKNYGKLLEMKSEFEKEGIPVVVDAIARCEEAGLCCGQLARTFLS